MAPILEKSRGGAAFRWTVSGVKRILQTWFCSGSPLSLVLCGLGLWLQEGARWLPGEEYVLSAPSPEHDVAAVPVTTGALAFTLIGPASITCSAVSQSMPLGRCRALIGQVWSGAPPRGVGRDPDHQPHIWGYQQKGGRVVG